MNSYEFGYGDPESTSQLSSQVTANTLKIHQKYQNKSSKDPKMKAQTNYTHPALKPIGSKFAGDSNSDENVNSDKADNSDNASPPLPTAAVSLTATSTDLLSTHADLKGENWEVNKQRFCGRLNSLAAASMRQNQAFSLLRLLLLATLVADIPNSAFGQAMRNSSTTKISNNKSHVSTSNDSSADGSATNSPSPTRTSSNMPERVQ